MCADQPALQPIQGSLPNRSADIAGIDDKVQTIAHLPNLRCDKTPARRPAFYMLMASVNQSLPCCTERIQSRPDIQPHCWMQSMILLDRRPGRRSDLRTLRSCANLRRTCILNTGACSTDAWTRRTDRPCGNRRRSADPCGARRARRQTKPTACMRDPRPP